MSKSKDIFDLDDLASGDFHERASEIQEKLQDLHVKGSSGGGMVTVEAVATGKLTKVEIDPAAMTESPTVLGDLVKAAVNEALRELGRAASDVMLRDTVGTSPPKMPWQKKS